MSDISKIKLNNTTYNIKDITARNNILTEMVVFGDSWSDSRVTEAVWSGLVSEQLRLNLHNYAVNGAGFIAPATKTIDMQVAVAENDTTYNKNQVKYVVVEGGLNDYTRSVTYTDLRVAIAQTLQSVKALFPNAKILYVNNFQYPYSVEQSHYWMNIQEFLNGAGYQALNQDGFYRKAYFLANLTHLTIPGQGLFANNIASALSGGEIYNEGIKLTFTSTASEIRIKRLNHHLIYDFNIKDLNDDTTSQTLILDNDDSVSWPTAFANGVGTIGSSYSAAYMVLTSNSSNKKVTIAKQTATKTSFSFNGTVGID